MAPECRAFWRTQRRPAGRAAAYLAAWLLLAPAEVLAGGAGSWWLWPIEAASVWVAVLVIWTGLDIGEAALEHHRSHEGTP